MKRIAAVLSLLLSGCYTIPQAALVYVQHTVAGIDVSVGDVSAATSPAHIKIGYSNDYGTLIPLAVGRTDAIKELKEILASNRVTINLDSSTQKSFAEALVKKVEDGTIFDVMSVYSSFDTQGKAVTQSPSAELSAGNVFATGFAARGLVSAKLAASCVRLQELIAAETDANKKKELGEILKARCS